MINIAMKSKDSIDRNTILSINNTRTQGSLSAGTISILNKSAPHNSPHPDAPVPSAHSQTNTRTVPAQNTARTTAVPDPVRSARPAAPASPVPPARPATPASPVSPARSETPASPVPPARRKLPAFAKPVQKGQKLPLSADGRLSGVFRACFGWNTSNPQCDADVSAFLLGDDGRVIGDSWFVFYGQTESPDKSCRFLTGTGADREVIAINFQKLNASVKKIVFVLTINEAFAKRLHFGMMQDAYIRILDERGTECVSFQMQEYYSNVISMMIGEIYQYNGSWKFHAVGNGVAKDLAGLCALYGVEVSD